LGQREDVPAVFRALDLTLMPSWDEPFGLAAIESLAMGTPSFVTRTSGAAEVLRDGVSGRVLSPRHPQAWADAICALLLQASDLERMGSAGRQVAAEFRDDKHA